MALSRSSYHRRVMGAMIAVLVLSLALVKGWPAVSPSASDLPFRDRPSERIQVSEIKPTNQSQERNPPPPAPLPPIVVPNDVLVKEDFEIGESTLQIKTPGEDEKLQDGTAQATAARQPDMDARLLRNVAPNYPSAAREEGVRARVEVEVEIDEHGQVKNATIRRRWHLSENGSTTPVTELGYGLEEAALAAARNSLFRPAQANGQPVATRKVITFTFGTN